MDRAFLEGLGLPEAAVAPILEKAGALAARLAGAEEQLALCGEEGPAALVAQRDEWRRRHDEDTAALASQLEALRRTQCAAQAMAPLRFTSQSAKRAFVQSLDEAALAPTEEGGLAGFDDFVAAYRQDDPGAFAPPANTAPLPAPPVFAAPVGGAGPHEAGWRERAAENYRLAKEE